MTESRGEVQERGDDGHRGQSIADGVVQLHEHGHLAIGESGQEPHAPQRVPPFEASRPQLLDRREQSASPAGAGRGSSRTWRLRSKACASAQYGPPRPRRGVRMTWRSRGTRCSRDATTRGRRRGGSGRGHRRAGAIQDGEGADVLRPGAAHAQHQLVFGAQPVDRHPHLPGGLPLDERDRLPTEIGVHYLAPHPDRLRTAAWPRPSRTQTGPPETQTDRPNIGLKWQATPQRGDWHPQPHPRPATPEEHLEPAAHRQPPTQIARLRQT